MDEMLGLLTVALEVMGIDEQSLNFQLNSDENRSDNGIFLTREYLRRIKDNHASKRDARDSSIEGSLL